MQNHPCTNLWVGILKHKYPITDELARAKYGDYWHTLDHERSCRQAGPLTRCMDWHKKYAASMKPCRAQDVCGCVKDTPERQAWRCSINPCS